MGPLFKKVQRCVKSHRARNGKSVRFDFISLPAVSNTDAKAPNVTIPVGVHPWDVKSDYSFYSYRQDLEWKDVIYSDVSFTKLSDESVLVGQRFSIIQSYAKLPCQLFFFAAISVFNIIQSFSSQ